MRGMGLRLGIDLDGVVADAKHEVVCAVSRDDAPDQVQRIAAARSADAVAGRFARSWIQPVGAAVDVDDRLEFDQVVPQPATALAG